MISTSNLCPNCMNDNGGEKVCSICGYDSATANGENCLPIGFKLDNRFIVGVAKTRNGEGITYIGWDITKNIAVDIKEYFPEGFSNRNKDKSVAMLKGGEYVFNEGLMDFLEINRAIMDSELPSLVPVVAVFEENGTVYAVSSRIAHITMGEFIAKNGGTLKWEQARPLFLPLIDTIKGMNDVGIIHGGISLKTVIVGRDGKLRLTGYSVKKLRNVEGELKEELFAGFAAAEQYGLKDMHIDNYTDVYGLCSTLFSVLIGNTPAEAPARMENDSMTVPAHFAEELPRHVLSALANGLQVLPANRTQNIEAFKNELVYAETTTPKVVKRENEQNTPQTKKKSGETLKYVVVSSVCTVGIFILIAAILIFTVFRDDIFTKTPETPTQDITSEAPDVDVLGSIDASAIEKDKVSKLPNLVGRYFSDISEEQLEWFVFSITDKEYSTKYAKGRIISQSVKAGSELTKGTKVELVVSLGPSEIKIANLLGMTEEQAKLELVKQGFLYDNIEVLDKYDSDKAPGTVIVQEPKYGTVVNTEIPIKIYINSHTESD